MADADSQTSTTSHPAPDIVPEILSNHWYEIPDWPPGRELWSFYVTLAGQTDLHATVGHYQNILGALPQLDMVPASSLHITIQGTRFVDEADPGEVIQVAEILERRLSTFEFPTLSTLSPTTDTDAIFLPVVPRNPFLELRNEIIRTVTAELGEEHLYRLPEPKNGFDPHISIAYANSELDSREVFDLLRHTASARTEFHVHDLSLIKLKREQRRWLWTDERPIRLGRVAQPI